jgi:hypothetical protein
MPVFHLGLLRQAQRYRSADPAEAPAMPDFAARIKTPQQISMTVSRMIVLRNVS